MLSQLRNTQGRRPVRVASAGGSRPSSADSSNPYDVSQSYVTEQQLRSKFSDYDAQGSGYMTRKQLIDFYKATNMFGADEDDDSVKRYLAGLCGDSFRNDMITFDDFAKVALKLAQR